MATTDELVLSEEDISWQRRQVDETLSDLLFACSLLQTAQAQDDHALNMAAKVLISRLIRWTSAILVDREVLQTWPTSDTTSLDASLPPPLLCCKHAQDLAPALILLSVMLLSVI